MQASGFEPLPSDPAAKVERKVQKLLAKHKTDIDLKRKFTPYHSKPPHLYGFPKTHKPTIPLIPIVSYVGSP
jgi:hypothetical protein